VVFLPQHSVVKAVANFAASCVKLGSDLQEVQNVVDVSFPTMSKKVNDFAMNAAVSFGLSETMAKKYMGTTGAMAKAFGFTEKEAFNMGATITGLAGDMASFYNMSQDEAFTKLKGIFTGETEALKDVGVVMTQANLDQYALANGYNKTTSAMTEQEKVALRYKFVQQQLSLASGDFIRTSGSWANQVRILKLQFEGFKASIGQGLINLLTPLLQMINLLMLKLVHSWQVHSNSLPSGSWAKALLVRMNSPLLQILPMRQLMQLVALEMQHQLPGRKSKRLPES
jgi:hypothetical protein